MLESMHILDRPAFYKIRQKTDFSTELGVSRRVRIAGVADIAVIGRGLD